jgi:uncharacterized membrane protein
MMIIFWVMVVLVVIIFSYLITNSVRKVIKEKKNKI